MKNTGPRTVVYKSCPKPLKIKLRMSRWPTKICLLALIQVHAASFITSGNPDSQSEVYCIDQQPGPQ